MNYKVEMLAAGTIRIGAPGAAELFSFVQLSDSHLRVPRADLPWTGELAQAMLEVGLQGKCPAARLHRFHRRYAGFLQP